MRAASVRALTALSLLLLIGCADRGPTQRTVQVFFLREAECEVHPVPRTVTGSSPLDFARAALELLVAGPTEEEVAAGFRSRLPDPDQIWRYRQSRLAFGQEPPYEGDELRLLEVREMEGRLLYANFSPELVAYGRGQDRVCEVIRQIEATVQQFEEYRNVSIAVNGSHRGILQP
ncbi:MAG: hypothetical protein DHS20C21_17030 [Gemmatimonadota bacterium]|nr:MAG: hypothetical protein DHS20C21_17030 [Gemmatimonadota bacterium]